MTRQKHTFHSLVQAFLAFLRAFFASLGRTRTSLYQPFPDPHPAAGPTLVSNSHTARIIPFPTVEESEARRKPHPLFPSFYA
jgi:hypothetical protein